MVYVDPVIAVQAVTAALAGLAALAALADQVDSVDREVMEAQVVVPEPVELAVMVEAEPVGLAVMVVKAAPIGPAMRDSTCIDPVPMDPELRPIITLWDRMEESEAWAETAALEVVVAMEASDRTARMAPTDRMDRMARMDPTDRPALPDRMAHPDLVPHQTEDSALLAAQDHRDRPAHLVHPALRVHPVSEAASEQVTLAHPARAVVMVLVIVARPVQAVDRE